MFSYMNTWAGEYALSKHPSWSSFLEEMTPSEIYFLLGWILKLAFLKNFLKLQCCINGFGSSVNVCFYVFVSLFQLWLRLFFDSPTFKFCSLFFVCLQKISYLVPEKVSDIGRIFFRLTEIWGMFSKDLGYF